VFLQLIQNKLSCGELTHIFTYGASFGTYEFDFVYFNKESERVLVEVKSSNSSSKSFNAFCDSNCFVDAVKYVKAKTDFGNTHNYSVPIFLAAPYTLWTAGLKERWRFGHNTCRGTDED